MFNSWKLPSNNWSKSVRSKRKRSNLWTKLLKKSMRRRKKRQFPWAIPLETWLKIMSIERWKLTLLVVQSRKWLLKWFRLRLSVSKLNRFIFWKSKHWPKLWSRKMLRWLNSVNQLENRPFKWLIKTKTTKEWLSRITNKLKNWPSKSLNRIKLFSNSLKAIRLKSPPETNTSEHTCKRSLTSKTRLLICKNGRRWRKRRMKRQKWIPLNKKKFQLKKKQQRHPRKKRMW